MAPRSKDLRINKSSVPCKSSAACCFLSAIDCSGAPTHKTLRGTKCFFLPKKGKHGMDAFIHALQKLAQSQTPRYGYLSHHAEPTVPSHSNRPRRHVRHRQNLLGQAFSRERSPEHFLRRSHRTAPAPPSARRWLYRNQRRRRLDGLARQLYLRPARIRLSGSRNHSPRRAVDRTRAEPQPRAGSRHHRQRHLYREQRADEAAPPNDHRVLGGVRRRAATADPALSHRSQAGIVARRLSAEERRNAARNGGTVLPHPGGRPAAELRSSGALHPAGGRSALAV